jgi:hypothetical protein
VDAVLYKNLLALGDEEKREAMVEYLDRLGTQHLMRMYRFFETLMRYSFAAGQRRALDYIEPFLEDVEAEKKATEIAMREALSDGKGED